MAALAMCLPLQAAQQPAQTPPAAGPYLEAPAAEPAITPAQRAKAEFYLGRYKALLTVLRSIEDEATAAAAIPELEKLNNDFAAFLALPDEDVAACQAYFHSHYDEMDDIYAGYRGEYLRLSGLDVLLKSDALAYELIVRENPAGVYFQNLDMAVAVHLTPNGEPTDPALAAFQQENSAAHQAAHEAYVKAHPDIYAGGNGLTPATAIQVLPGTKGKIAADDPALEPYIFDYLSEVYPDGESAFSFAEARPDGSFYLGFQIIYGLYTGADGRRHVKTHPVYFQLTMPH